MRRDRQNHWQLSLAAIFGMVGTVVVFIGGCSGIETAADRDRAGEAFIELDVEPETADIYIDDEYRGTVDGWHHQMVPVQPGHRRLKLRADGYVPQRFDVEVDQDRTVTVRVRLEPSISAPDGTDLDEEDRPDGSSPGREDDSGDEELTPPAHPTAPE